MIGCTLLKHVLLSEIISTVSDLRNAYLKCLVSETMMLSHAIPPSVKHTDNNDSIQIFFVIDHSLIYNYYFPGFWHSEIHILLSL